MVRPKADWASLICRTHQHDHHYTKTVVRQHSYRKLHNYYADYLSIIAQSRAFRQAMRFLWSLTFNVSCIFAFVQCRIWCFSQLLSLTFYPNVTTLHLGLCSLAFVHPTQGVEAFLLLVTFLHHCASWPSFDFVQNFTEILPGEPLRRGR